LLQAVYLITKPDLLRVDDKAARARAREIFAKMDSNQDGVLSKEEFVRGCLEDNALYRMLASKFDM